MTAVVATDGALLTKARVDSLVSAIRRSVASQTKT
jgi:hypothetical protein